MSGDDKPIDCNLPRAVQRLDKSDILKRMEEVARILSRNGCECECEHHWEDHEDDCERCLACEIEEALFGRY